jgi:hypothetical protein
MEGPFVERLRDDMATARNGLESKRSEENVVLECILQVYVYYKSRGGKEKEGDNVAAGGGRKSLEAEFSHQYRETSFFRRSKKAFYTGILLWNSCFSAKSRS